METSEPTQKKVTIPRRPLKLTEQELHQIEQMSGLGLNQFQIASVLGISRASLQRCKASAQIVTDAVEKGKSRGLLVSGTELMKKVRDGDIAAIKWYETTRHKMSEKTESEVTHKVESIESYLRRIKDVGKDEAIEIRALNNSGSSAATANHEYSDIPAQEKSTTET